MRRWRMGGWGVAILVGVSLQSQLWAGEPSTDAPPPAKKADSSFWPGSWFGTKDKPSASKTTPSNKAKKNEGTTAAKHGVLEESAAERAREQATLLRRLAVCDQLRAVAARKQDEALMHQADTLDEQCWETYTRRVAHLSTGRAVTEAGGKQNEPPARTEEAVHEVSGKPKGK